MSAVESRPKMMFGAAAALYIFSLVEVSPAFVAPSTRVEVSRSPSLRGSTLNAEASNGTPVFARTACQMASTFLTLSACAIASRSRGKKTERSLRTQLCVKADDAKDPEQVISPIHTYAAALGAAALKKEEIRAVTKDVMKAKSMMQDDEFMENEVRCMINEAYLTEAQKAEGLCKLWGPLESTVFPKFMTFIAKKERLPMLTKVFDQYMKDQYSQQSIMPVRVVSAKRLSDAQKEKIIAKMKDKTGATDIKLVCEISSELVSGFTLEWGFTDPDVMKSPTAGLDMSVKSIVKRAAVKEGVPVNI